MRTLFYSCLLLILLTSLGIGNAQSTITGTVISQEYGAIQWANVYIEGTYTGTSTDSSGFFSFQAGPQDTIVLRVSYIGYRDYRAVFPNPEKEIRVQIILQEIANQLGEVVISAGTFEAGTASKSQVLRPLDIVTTAGVTADVPGALNTLPGTQTVGEEGRLFVRGGDGYETTTFIDGMMVLESYDLRAPNVPARSRFSPFLFSGTNFSTGGYSAEYGQGLSSALILNTKDVSRETRTDLSLISVGLEASHTQMWEASSLAGKLGYYDLDPYFGIISQDLDWIDPPTTLDGSIAYRRKAGKRGMLKSYGKLSRSAMAFNYDPFVNDGRLIRMEQENNYGYANVSFKDVFSGKWSLRTGASYTWSDDQSLLDQDLVSEQTRGLHLKSVSGYAPNDHIFFRMGGELFARKHFQDFVDFETEFENRLDFRETIVSGFVEADWYLSDVILMRLGGRTEINSLSDQVSLDPRISLAIKSGDLGQFSVAYGHFRQSAPTGLLRIAPELSPEKAVHYIINYQVIDDLRSFRVEAYWKEYSNLVTFDPAAPFLPQSYLNTGDGYARGIDVFYRDGQSFENVDFWISYSFLDTERHYRDFPARAAPAFTSRHNFSVVYKHFIPTVRSQVGMTYAFASGRPYDDPQSPQFNRERTPAYHDLSANISYLPTRNLILHASITNILGRENIFGYDFRPEQNNPGVYESRPVTLPAPRFLFLGIFLTLSKNGTVNQLPQL